MKLNTIKKKSDLLLKKAKSLMEIYRESNIKEYHLFLKKDENIECDRTRYISSLPLFTISDELLIKILKRTKYLIIFMLLKKMNL